MSEIASRLADLRRRSGIGVRGFAAALERGASYSVSHTSVSQYEGGTTIPAAYLAAVSRTFGVDPRWLLTGEGHPEPLDRSSVELAFEEIGRIVAGVHPVPLMVETLWETFFRLSPDPFCILTIDGHISKLNPAWEAILGYPLEELYEQSIFDHIVEEDRDRVREVLHTLSHRGGTDRFATRIRSQRGEDRYFSWSATGTEGLIFAIARDITDLRAAEERLRRSEASLAAAQRIAGLGNWEWRIDTGELYWSQEIYRILGLDQGEVEPSFPLLLRAIHPDDRSGLESAVEATLETGAPYSIEYRILRPDGETRVIHARAELYHDPEGQPMYLRGTSQDITARKANEEELRRRDLILQAVAFAAERLVKAPDWAEAIDDVLERLGDAIGIDQISLGKRTDRGDHSLPGRWQNLLSIGQIVAGAAESLPESERDWLRTRSIESILILPILLDGEWWGHLSFSDTVERLWPLAEIEALRIATLIVGAAILRDRAEQAARRLAGEHAARIEAEAAREEIHEILESIRSAFIAVSPTWEISYLNHEGEVLLGRSRAELNGHRLWDLLPDGEGSELYRECRRVAETGATSVVETFYSPLGRWYEVHLFPRRTGLSLYFHDLTDRRRAEEELRISEARFSGILSVAADAIISIDEAQRITLFNRGAEEIFGYTASEILGQELEILLPERFRAAHLGHIDHFKAAPERARYMGQRMEIRGLRRDGEEFPAEATISKIELGGELALTVILRDIGRRKGAESELQLKNALLDALLTAGSEAADIDLETILTEIIEEVCTAMGWPVGLGHLVNRDGGLDPAFGWHLTEPGRYGTLPDLSDPDDLARCRGVAGLALAAGQSIWSEYDVGGATSAVERHARGLGLTHSLCIPVTHSAGPTAVLIFLIPPHLVNADRSLEVMERVRTALCCIASLRIGPQQRSTD